MKHLEALRKAVDDFLAEPFVRSKGDVLQLQLRAAAVFVRETLRQLAKQPREKR